MSFIFNANEDPRQREMRLRQQQMQGLDDRMGVMPQNVGQGLQALGDAFTYRHLAQQQQQAASDPWAAMREPSRSGLFDLGKGWSSLSSFFRK